jgi:Pectate lyase superfamily protein
VIGIHWQTSQACTLQNIDFLMPPLGRHIGVYMEDGSGGNVGLFKLIRDVINDSAGFVSDLTFTGGGRCWMGGNQQFTARNIRFDGCSYVFCLCLFSRL